jgi:hypothetical protein
MVFGSKSLDGDGALLVVTTMEAFLLFFFRRASRRRWLFVSVYARFFLQSSRTVLHGGFGSFREDLL